MGSSGRGGQSGSFVLSGKNWSGKGLKVQKGRDRDVPLEESTKTGVFGKNRE